MVFNTKFEVEKFDRMNRQFEVIHILILELDTVLEDKLEDKDNGVNTCSIHSVWAIKRKTCVSAWIAFAIFFLPKNRRRRKEQGDGNRTRPCGGRRSSKRSIFLSSVVEKFEMKTVFVLHVLREREREDEREK